MLPRLRNATGMTDRCLGGVGIERGVGPAEEAAAPRSLVVRRAVDEPAVARRQRPCQHELTVAPQARVGDRVHGGWQLGVVLTLLVTARGVADAETGEVELMGAVHAWIGDLGDRGAPSRQLHALDRAQVGGRVGARAPRPPAGPGLDARHTLAVVTQRDLEVMEVVLEPALDHAVVDRGRADSPPVRTAGIADADGRRA